MRRVLPPANATFNAANGTITFATTIPASISHILRVTNLDRAVVYFDPTNPTNSGVLSGATYASPVLTLKANTSTHSNTDRLYIEYDDGQGLVDVQITGPVTVSNEVEIKNDSGSPIPTLPVDGLAIPAYDHIALSYAGTNLTGVVYKSGGASGTTVATLTLAYNGSNQLTSVSKS